jgi:hypothetical protein
MSRTTFLAVALAAVATALAAQPAAALNLPATKYYQKMVIQDCGAVTKCDLVFPAVPADQALFVSTVSCTTAFQPAETVIWRITVDSNLDPMIALTLEKTGAKNNSVAYASRQEGDFFITPGQKPRITIQTSGATTQNAICTVIGRLVAP